MKAKSKIFVVDDEPVSLNLCHALLTSNHEYEVTTFSSGAEFFDGLTRSFPDLVLLDIVMPEMSGFKVLEKIRQNHSALELPVIMLTADDKKESIVSALEIGANDYVLKPFDPHILLARAQNFLRLKSLFHVSVEAMEANLFNKMLSSYNQQMNLLLQQTHSQVEDITKKDNCSREEVCGLKTSIGQIVEISEKVNDMFKAS